MQLLEFRQDRRQHAAAQAGPAGDAQPTSQFGLCRPQRAARCFRGVQDRLGAVCQAPAGLGQSQRARGPREQGLAHQGLDRGDAPAHRGALLPQLARRPRKAARLNDAGEQLECIGIQPGRRIDALGQGRRFRRDWLSHGTGLYSDPDLVNPMLPA